MARNAAQAIRAALYLLLALAVANCAFAGRVLDEQPAAQAEAPLPADPLPAPTDPPTGPVVVAPAAGPAAAAGAAGAAAAGAAATGNAGAASGGAAAANAGAGAAGATGDHPLTFFMHDILGGSQPSGRIVTGVVASAAANGQLPFARPNTNIFPIQGAVPLPQGASNLINSNNVPYVAGLGGTSGNLVQNNGNTVNGGNKNIPFVNPGDLPSGVTLENLLFGTTTVIDDELTEGHELGAGVIGRAQGFYVASSQDGTSKTMVLTAMFEGPDAPHGDTLSFFGVHRMAAPESHIAIIGGTGKYENAKGFAAIQTLHPGDEHTTDGVETLLQFNIHLI
ncbi:Dirigent protein 24 [Dichanthelium oligosanthes]|uniref:Dirigent protein n=1 Tax=Dichanthelium oligosanthes TaxID=888268 RepID=A0A1E5UIZ7_9POAL|nr:Dirigent protein 24 [Dichanthelium oligosanthes]